MKEEFTDWGGSPGNGGLHTGGHEAPFRSPLRGGHNKGKTTMDSLKNLTGNISRLEMENVAREDNGHNGRGHLHRLHPAGENLVAPGRRNGTNGHASPALLTLRPARRKRSPGPAKRLFDIVAGSLLLILSLPAFLGISLAIWLDSSGPIIIRQVRIGRNRRNGAVRRIARDQRNGDLRGKPFEIYKFRTMRQGADLYAVKPQGICDPRVTRLGGILRRSGLDELPQLFNVIKGEMSLVGPRPEMPFIVRAYYNDHHARRLQVKPGITGIWQLYGSRKKHIHEEIDLDLAYIENFSLWLDIKLLFKTLKFALQMKNI